MKTVDSARAFVQSMTNQPGVWFECPPNIGAAGVWKRGIEFWLDPSIFEIWRDRDESPMYARKRLRPTDLKEG